MAETTNRNQETQIPIKRALVSVWDKTGLEELAAALVEAGVQIISTGSTAKKIAAAGFPVTPVEDVTGFPECLEGRVKTLHPHIHAGILADRRKPDHVKQLQDLQVEPIDLVVCNLYPFEDTVASGADFDACVEQIDIGGPSMVRAAAKNHPSVAVVTAPFMYPHVIEAVQNGGFDLRERRILASQAFAHTAEYDAAIATWFDDQITHFAMEAIGAELDPDATGDNGADALPEWVEMSGDRDTSLRYGENPHQAAALYIDMDALAAKVAEGGPDSDCMCPECAPHPDLADVALCDSIGADETIVPAPGIANAIQLHGKEMSFNNYTDGDAAIRAAYDHAEPCVAIIKHANPCGIAVAADVATAHRKAHACDPVSAFGGVIAVNRPVTVELAKQIAPIFTEVVLAPSYEPGAVSALAAKKNVRVLKVTPPDRGALEIRQISGGYLAQQRDDVAESGDRPGGWTKVCGPDVDEATLHDLEFAWQTIRATKSNAILLAHDGATVGIGMGQVNRVDSCKLAVERANTLGGRETGDAAASAQSDVAGGARADDLAVAAPPERARGAVAASDAFFPFADGPQILIDAGVKAIVQPGGSIRDQETIDVCEKAGVTMFTTGVRHFFH
ncbi:bifunctional phosphoribosylaminoimidazolecarboxamide formyltransferase/inosine monophosphate cyclohydrolase [uncultured Mobiluncus sp.]|uniref:bifunctional phosphoribosylaminoimidazolecarboxamide formyltransferase/inosine monophosphate cyclohydrolase n=1 Tax=uncultured Mobiluncus sp. TaxID=293425 RepID=UPI0028895538|nr:bifunctional phosphoribosylaminoimidazolecarboxamide formyltransferase/inosine monophosphate cyclohydrolase [uncultured Mobiluncus sp.]